MRLLAASLALAAGALCSVGAVGGEPSETLVGLDGRGVMAAVYERHRQFPFVYEELALVLIDGRGRRTSRQARRFTRAAADGSVRFLLLFDAPAEVQGVGLLATRQADGTLDTGLYLPALGGGIVTGGGSGVGGALLGSDFSIEDLAGEDLDAYRYTRRGDSELAGVPHAVVDVRGPDRGRVLRRHFVRLDNTFITRTDHFDGLGRLERRLTAHDLAAVSGEMWAANMLLMDHVALGHQSLLKVQRRVFSRDYVPEEVFTLAWLRANRPPVEVVAEAAAPVTPAEPAALEVAP